MALHWGSNAAAEKLFETIDPAPGTLTAPVPWRTTVGRLAGIKGNPEQLASIGWGESSSEFPRRHRCHRFDPSDRPGKALQPVPTTVRSPGATENSPPVGEYAATKRAS